MSNDSSLRRIWKLAATMDATVRVRDKQWDQLLRKQVTRLPYSRHRMFLAMARRQVAIFADVPVLVQRRGTITLPDAVAQAISTRFSPRATSRVQIGPQHKSSRLPVREIMRRWSGRRAIVGVTDLHIRASRLAPIINTDSLSDFNLLIRGSEDLALQEMMTLVIASAGNVTDSHSDDPDGTNHCFAGSKLWLAWDAFEGMAQGIQDESRQEVPIKARFDLGAFLELKSAKWFIVAPGDTLFLPGNLTHKVLTLEPYLGIGSFYVGLPGSFDSLTRWLYHGPLWSIDDPQGHCAGLVDECARICLRYLQRCQAGSRAIRARWGYDYVGTAYRTWLRNTPAAVRVRVSQHPAYNKILALACQCDEIRRDASISNAAG